MTQSEWCCFCGGECLPDPVRDPVTVSWVGAGAPVFCSTRCMDAADEMRIDAAGNTP